MKARDGIPSKQLDVVLLVGLYVLECASLLTGFAIYKRGGRPLSVFLSNPAGVAMVAGVLAIAMSSVVVLRRLLNPPSSPSRWIVKHIAVNLSTLAVMLATAEVAIRILTVDTSEGQRFANTLLVPRSWTHVSSSCRAVLAKATLQGSYLVFDDLLGWSVGRNRRSENGLYASSLEGIRSREAGTRFTDGPAKRRIAIVGDSFTFGVEVSYEDTWGYKLEQELGSDFQVLNFGVDGYGIDQTYLRYSRDVRPWHPDVVIFSLIDDDFRRTMGVYGFLTFTTSLPFPKPRFVMRDHRLVPINIPLPRPENIFATHTIRELPFVEYDGSFRDIDWEWHVFFHAYSVRLLLSRYPRWTAQAPDVSDDAKSSVNGELLRMFMRLAREEGTTPLVVVFPSRTYFEMEPKSRTLGALQILRANGIPYIDMTGCASAVDETARFLVRHYSPTANAAIARCMMEFVRASGPE
jgi:hypothetical protein